MALQALIRAAISRSVFRSRGSDASGLNEIRAASRYPTAPPAFEMLESRQLLSGATYAPNQGLLRVDGTEGADTIEISMGLTASSVEVRLNGALHEFDVGEGTFDRIVVDGLAGDDLIDVRISNVLSSLAIQGGRGSDIIFAGDRVTSVLTGDGNDVVITRLGFDRLVDLSDRDLVLPSGLDDDHPEGDELVHWHGSTDGFGIPVETVTTLLAWFDRNPSTVDEHAPVSSAPNQWHHAYPLYLGGSPDQPLIELTDDQHKKLHVFLSKAELGYQDPLAGEKWKRMTDAERRDLIRQSLRQAGVSDLLIDRILDNVMLDSTPGEDRPRSPVREFQKAVTQAEVKSTPQPPISPAEIQRQTKRLAAILEKLDKLDRVLTLFAAVGVSLTLGANIADAQDPTSALRALQRYQQNQTSTNAEQARQEMIDWVYLQFGDNEVTRAWELAFRSKDMRDFLP